MIKEFFYQEGDGIVQGCMYRRTLTKTSIVASENKVEWHRGLKNRPDSYSLIKDEMAKLLEIGFRAGLDALKGLGNEIVL